MNAILFRMLISVAMKALTYLYEQRKKHTAEQQAELKTALTEVHLEPVPEKWEQLGPPPPAWYEEKVGE